MFARFDKKSAKKTKIIKDVVSVSKRKLFLQSLEARILKWKTNSRLARKIFVYNQFPFLSYPLIFTFLFLFIVATSFFGYFLTIRANIVNFYPASCLGGWENPQNATSHPDLDEGAEAEEFNEANSAVLRNTIAQIFCGDFQGEKPDEAEIKKVVLKFSWTIKEKEEISDSIATATTTIYGEDFASSTQEILDLPPDQPAEFILTVPEEATSTSATTSTEELIQETETTAPEPEQESAPPPTTEENPPPEENQIPEESPSSFFKKLFNIVFAQEDTNLHEEDTPRIDTNINTNEHEGISGDLVDSTTSTTTEETATTTQETSTTTQEIATSTPTSTSETEITLAEENFLEVLYTLDGANWLSLGKINKNNWQKASFEIPVSTWDDLSKIQISLQALATIDEQPIVYLDSLWLETEFEKIKEDIKIEEKSGRLILRSDDFPSLDENDFVLDPNALHTCSISPFSQNVQRDQSVRYSIQLNPSVSNKPFRLRLGDYPEGMIASFEKLSENEITLSFALDNSAPLGSYNIVIVYDELQKNDEISSNICQLNLIIQ